MRSRVAVYDTHEKAVEAVKLLSDYDFPLKRVSIIGKVEEESDNLKIQSLEPVKNAPVFVGAGAGAIVGLLSGLGLFAIPGFGVLYGAGAVIGAIAGFDIGLVSGGVVTLLATLGIKKEYTVKYEEHLKKGMFMVCIQGSLAEVERAEYILHDDGSYIEFD